MARTLLDATADGGGVLPREAIGAPTASTPAENALPDDDRSADVAAPGPSAWLVVLVPLSAWAALFAPIPGTLLPLASPASGLLAGLLLGAGRGRTRLLVLGAAGIALAHLAHGTDPGLAVAFAAACAAEAVVVRRVLTGPGGRRRAALLDDGDVNRMISALALGGSTAGAGYALALLAAGDDRAHLALVATAATHAASLMLLLPLFMLLPDFPPVAPLTERLVQWAVALGTTGVVAATADAPPLLFIVMPTFAWLGFRGTLREATGVLIGVGVLTTALTSFGLGPVAALSQYYDIAPELAAGYLQLFLLDCGLILLPLSVSVAQHRSAAADAAAGRDTLERLLDAATATAIVATDAAGRVTVFNPGAEAMLGYAASEVVGHPPDRFYPAAELHRLGAQLGTAPTFAAICAAVAESDEVRRLWTFQRRDGSTGTMLMTAAPLGAGPRGAGGFMCTAEDVTEQERAQAALVAALEDREAAMARLEELDRIRTDFVSTVSHELRTPITSIIGYSSMLQDPDGVDLPPPHRAAADRIGRNSRRLLELIEDLLTATQVQTRELAAAKEPCDVRDVVAAAVEAAAGGTGGRDLALAVSVPDEPVALLGDPTLLERMVANLLSNAIKFTLDGGAVDVTLRAGPSGIEVVVCDTGVGIPEDEQERLFTRFFRSSTAATMAVQGTGLGLVIAQAIAQLHGGEARIDSDGSGTTATVWLPRSTEQASTLAT